MCGYSQINMNYDFSNEIRGLNDLRQFLRNAPEQFQPGQLIRKHELPNAEVISCVKWDEDFLISGVDILRCVVYRFEALGREVANRAKFEELVISDLRSLKTNVRARLEIGKSNLLEFLHRHGCIRTKKKQRVFFWYAVPHDRLFLESLERELRRSVVENSQNEKYRTTRAVCEPSFSMKYDPMQKVAHQIEWILQESPALFHDVLEAVFGLAPEVFETIRSPGLPLRAEGLRPSSTPTTYRSVPLLEITHEKNDAIKEQQPNALSPSDFRLETPTQLSDRSQSASPFSYQSAGLEEYHQYSPMIENYSRGYNSMETLINGAGLGSDHVKRIFPQHAIHMGPDQPSIFGPPPSAKRRELCDGTPYHLPEAGERSEAGKIQLPSIKDILPPHAQFDLASLEPSNKSAHSSSSEHLMGKDNNKRKA